MENSEEKTPEEILLDKLDEAEQIGSDIASLGRAMTRDGQLLMDIARATREVAMVAPQTLQTDTQLRLWEGAITTSKKSHKGVIQAQDSSSSAVSTASTAYMAASISIRTAYTDTIPTNPFEWPESTKTAIANFERIASRNEIKDDVISLMRLFSFDKARPGNSSPLELFQIAHNAYERPVSEQTPVSTSLIPMRGSINLIITELLRLRPEQEKTGNNFNKIISIGLQFRRSDLSEIVIEELAERWDKLVDELSKAKVGSFSREEWSQQLYQASFFLYSLLKGLDPDKVNRKAR